MNHDTMSPDRFHDLLDQAVHDGAAYAGVDVADVTGDVAAGRRRLRRRRTAVAALAAVAVVATSTALLTGDRHHSQAIDEPPTTDEALIRTCQGGEGGERSAQRLFDSGTPRVMSVARSSNQVRVALESADGTLWADCFVHLQTAEFAAGMTAYPVTPDPHSVNGFSYSFGPGCGLVTTPGSHGVDPGCRTFEVSSVDHLPREVAAVEYRTGDGETTRVETTEGYVAFDHLGDLPDDVRVTADGDFRPEFAALAQITYLDDDGDPIAAQRTEGSGLVRVPGLPPLDRYPSLRGDILAGSAS